VGKGHQKLLLWFHRGTKTRTLLGHQTAAASQLGGGMKQSTAVLGILLAVLESSLCRGMLS